MEYLRVVLDSWQGKIAFGVFAVWFIWKMLLPVYDWAKPEIFEWYRTYKECPKCPKCK